MSIDLPSHDRRQHYQWGNTQIDRDIQRGTGGGGGWGDFFLTCLMMAGAAFALIYSDYSNTHRSGDSSPRDTVDGVVETVQIPRPNTENPTPQRPKMAFVDPKIEYFLQEERLEDIINKYGDVTVSLIHERAPGPRTFHQYVVDSAGENPQLKQSYFPCSNESYHYSLKSDGGLLVRFYYPDSHTDISRTVKLSELGDSHKTILTYGPFPLDFRFARATERTWESLIRINKLICDEHSNDTILYLPERVTQPRDRAL